MASELILQFQQGNRYFSCEKYENLPSPRSAYIAICFTDSQQAEQQASDLKHKLLSSINSITNQFVKSNPPCGNGPAPFMGCQALGIKDNVKLLIVVTDGKSNQFLNSQVVNWKDTSLVVLPSGNHVTLPVPFNIPQAAFWHIDIDEVIPTIYRLLGISDEDQRIFISYRRTDTSLMAEQLCDALSHEGFEVFLDRFSIEPGVHFQNRLYQELADKAMVVFLESPDFLNSQWIQLEIAFVKKYRLGFLALNINGSPEIASIDDEYRREIAIDQLEPAFKVQDSILKETRLKQIVRDIKLQHSVALYRMRNYLNSNIMSILLGANPLCDANGFISVDSTRGTSQYKIWATPRPPKVKDFHYSDICNSSEKRIIVGPTFMEDRREILNAWLSNKTSIQFYNEGQLLELGQLIL